MKKLYTLLLGVAVALSASATTASRLAKVQKTAEAAKIEFSNIRTTGNAVVGESKIQSSFQKAPARITPVENWVDVRTVKYTDDLMTTFMEEGKEVSQTMDVMLQQLDGDDTQFRLVNPYKNWVSPFADVKVDDSKDYYIKFKIEGDLVCVYGGETGVLAATNEEMTEFAPISFKTQAQDFADEYALSMIEQVCPGICGVYNAGTVTYPIGFEAEGKSYVNFLMWIGSEEPENGRYAGANLSGKFRIVMDENAKDYSFKFTTPSECISDSNIQFTLESGADINDVKILLFPGGWFTANEDNFSFIEENLNESLQSLPAINGSMNLPLSNVEDGPATFFALAYDATGTRVKATALHLLITADNAADWSYIGMATFTESLMSSVWVDSNKNPWNAETYEVEMEQHKTQKGLYRLKNIYTNTKWTYSQANAHPATGCNHYLYIDATNPNAVEIPLSYPGFESSQYGHEMIASFNSIYEGGTADKSGKFADNKITFPADCILETTPGDIDPDKGTQNWYKVNSNGNFQVVLPTSGINDAVIDLDNNAPVEYFNLQGVRVANPAAGELVIKRQGETVTKTIVR